MRGPNRKFEQIYISSYLDFGIQNSVFEGMHRCICSFNHAISEIRGSESDNQWPGFAARSTGSEAGDENSAA